MNIPADQACATLTIDLGALAANWRKLSIICAPAECAAVVKADAYGLGIEHAVPALAKAGCRTFFVAHSSEGARARSALSADQRDCRIYVLNGLPAGDDRFEALIEHGLRPVLGSLDELARWARASAHAGVGLPAALHVDTGMNRLGLPPGELGQALAHPAAIDLVMSHFVSAERRDDPINPRQMSAFRDIARGFPGVAASLANSSGMFLPQKPFHDLARPGYALYGGNPTPGEPNPMAPVVSLHAPIIQLRDVKAGETAGYNALWTAPRDSRLATIGIGYADGFPRGAGMVDGRATPGAEAIVAGVRCPFVGRTSMDLTILDVTRASGAAAVGAPVEILGNEIQVDELGQRSGTIGYEILTSLGRRYRRVLRQ